MKILLTGNLPVCTATIASRLHKGGHQVSVLGHLGEEPNLGKEIAYHPVDVNNPRALRLMEAAEVDAVLFFFAYECERGRVRGAMLDTLREVLRQAEQRRIERFVLITDRRVFGDAQEGREDETPLPGIPEGVLMKAAEECLAEGKPREMQTLTVRVTSLYDEGDSASFFAHVTDCARQGKTLVFPGNRNTPCDFVHADDLAAFLDFALGDSLHGVAHVYYGKHYTYGDVEAMLNKHYPNLMCVYTEGTGRAATLQGDAMRRVDWVPRHHFARELDTLCPPAEALDGGRGKGRKFRGWRRTADRLLPWMELFLGALLAIAADRAGQENAVFSVIDYKLLFVAVMGNLYGMRFGVLSALIACVYYALNWKINGNDLYILLYNFDHWLPLGCYMLCGSLFGYLRDKHREQLATVQREQQELKGQNAFLQKMYDLAYQDRSQMQEQVMHFRDSYGRIYNITKALDTLQPEQIYLSTLGILEDVLQNKSVAIYISSATSSFVRLVVHSRDMTNVQRSIQLEKFRPMERCLREGRVFSNTELLPGYPAYAAPVMNEGKLNSILMLWDVPFEKRTQRMENLLSILAGLVQSAVVRTQRYFAMMDNVYIEDTHILTDQAYRNALTVYRDIRRQRTGQYLLVRVWSTQALDIRQYDARIGRVARSTDLIGQLEDGRILILFPQADTGNLTQIVARLAEQGLQCEPISMEDIHV